MKQRMKQSSEQQASKFDLLCELPALERGMKDNTSTMAEVEIYSGTQWGQQQHG